MIASNQTYKWKVTEPLLINMNMKYVTHINVKNPTINVIRMKIMCSERLQTSERMIRIKYFEINTWKRRNEKINSNVKRREKNVEINDIPCELRKLN